MTTTLQALAGRQAQDFYLKQRARSRRSTAVARARKDMVERHTPDFLHSLVASGGQQGMGLTPRTVERIKAAQRGLGMPKEIEIGITKDGIVICSDQDFDRAAFMAGLKKYGIEVVDEKVTICG